MDTVRIPLWIPKLYSTPVEQEVVTRQTFQTPAAPMMAPLAVGAAPAPMMAYSPQPMFSPPAAYAPAPPMYAPAPQQAYAPAPPMYAPAPQQAYAPAPPMYAPAPQQVYALPQPPTTIQGVMCVPAPSCQSGGQSGCQPAIPLPCPPGSNPGGVMLNQINHLEQKLDTFERDYRQQQGLPAAPQRAGVVTTGWQDLRYPETAPRPGTATRGSP